MKRIMLVVLVIMLLLVLAVMVVAVVVHTNWKPKHTYFKAQPCKQWWQCGGSFFSLRPLSMADQLVLDKGN